MCRRFRRSPAMLVLGLWLLGHTCVSMAMAQTIEEIQRNIIVARDNIKHGVLKIHVDVQVDTKAQAQGNQFDRREEHLDIRFRDHDLRIENVRTWWRGEQPSKFSCYHLRAAGNLFHHTSDRRFAAELDTEDHASGIAKGEIFNPRICGMLLTRQTCWKNHDLADLGIWLARPESTVAKLHDNGTDKLNITRSHANDKNKRFTTTVAPDRGYAIEQMGFVSPNHLTMLIAEYHHFPGGVWFPKQIIYEETHDGQIDYREVVTIDGSFAKPPADADFELSSLRLAEGTKVRAFGAHMLWDGEKLVPDPAWQSVKKSR